MAVHIAFLTHELTEDNESGHATGWLPGRLSVQGRANAAQIATRSICRDLDAIFSSDLARAVETVRLAFPDTPMPVMKDWRLRECDYGALNGAAAAQVHGARQHYLDRAYPQGESWRQAVTRVGRFLDDLPMRWAGCRVLVVGHVATRWGFEQFLNGAALEDLLNEDFVWQEGWEYVVPS